ncbi:carboxypeptidase regulatory-like domain-containing protein [Natronoglomus mannanivorans]|uniref:Carboxypeptidase regulatory-like domain-containing protein n=1 Tax=Natronoglomus mannanivorans TaxID=2979990 RepID=A0AAP2Z136_9EURY|nr:carboxypeptidase regulatory-like domain-containing protein [Halobacteria archaeon AArc-xg1-1]
MASGNPDATNYYDRLGVSESDDCDEIEAVARPIVPEYHPDRNPDSGTDEFQRMKEARSVLTDETKRSRYDDEPVSLQIRPESERVPTETSVEIRVVDGDDGGVPKASVIVETQSESESFETDGNGAVAVRFSDPGERTVRADKHDYETNRYVPAKTDVLVEERTRELSLRVKSETIRVGEEISVIVTDERGSPVPNATLVVQNEAGKTKTQHADPHGIVTFTIETPGTYRLVAREDGYAEAETLVDVTEQMRLSLAVSTNKIRAGEPFTVVVTDQHGDPVDGVRVVLRDHSQTVDSDRTGSNGEVRLTAPGVASYTVETNTDGADDATRDVYVTAETETGTGTESGDGSHERQRGRTASDGGNSGGGNGTVAATASSLRSVAGSLFGSGRTRRTETRRTTATGSVSNPAVSSLLEWLAAFPVTFRVLTVALIVGGVSVLSPGLGSGGSGSGADAMVALGLCAVSLVAYDVLPRVFTSPEPRESELLSGVPASMVAVLLVVATGFILAGQGSVSETFGGILFVAIIPVALFVIMPLLFGLFGAIAGAVFGNASGGGWFGAVLGGGLILVMQFTTWGMGVNDQIHSGEYGVTQLPWAVVDDFTILFLDVGMIVTFVLSVVVLAGLVAGGVLAPLVLFHHPRQRSKRGDFVAPLCWDLAVAMPLVLFAWAVATGTAPAELPFLASTFGAVVATETGFLELVWLPLVGATLLYSVRERVEPSYAAWRGGR